MVGTRLGISGCNRNAIHGSIPPMVDPARKIKPVQPTNEGPSTNASNPGEVRGERADARTQSVSTPDGAGKKTDSGGQKSVGARK